MSKSFCDEFGSELAGIEFIFSFHGLDIVFSIPMLEICSFFSNPVAITVIWISSDILGSVTVPNMMFASGSTDRKSVV